MATNQASAPRVALLVETSKAFGRGVLLGVNRYVKEHEHWSIYLEPRDLGTIPPPWLATWSGDGIIARISEPRIADIVLNTGLPTVNVSAAMPELTLPRVESNPHSQGKMAARYLFERGFRNFAFCGDKQRFWNWSQRVAAGYWEFLSQSLDGEVSQAMHYIGAERKRDWDAEQAALETWISSLPKPLAILAVNDPVGLRLLEACHRTGFQVPEHVVVLGLENDELVCALADPPLSSLIPNSQMVGYRAAEMLDAMIRGELPAEPVTSIEPVGIVTRLSTDITAHHDDVVANALIFIRKNACNGISVEDVVRSLKVSRSSLDRRFQATLGRSPHEEIVRAKMKRAMQLLAETSLNLSEIAFKVGYEHAEYMSVVFKRELGITAKEYRAQSSDSPMGQIPER